MIESLQQKVMGFSSSVDTVRNELSDSPRTDARTTNGTSVGYGNSRDFNGIS